MKRISSSLVVGALVAVVWAASSGVVFRDKDGNMTVSDLRSWKVTQVSASTISFAGSGSPFVGVWKSQGLNVRGRTITGTAQKVEGKGFVLNQARVTGGVTAIMSDRAEGEGRTTTVKGDSANLTAGSEKSQLSLNGSVSVKSLFESSGRKMTMSGHDAVLTMLPLEHKGSEYPVRHLVLHGPVKMHLDTFQVQSGERKVVIADSVSDELIYDEASLTITLTGNLKITGTAGALGGDVTASSAVISLTSKHELKEIEFKGDPGESTFKDDDTP